MLNDIDPEEIFKMVSVLPKKGVKVEAHLEDEDGEKITIGQICKELTEYVTENLKDEEDNPINTQLFPLSTNLIVNIVPRFTGVEVAAFLMSTTLFRSALSTLSLSSFLFNQYIVQHKLKIVSVSTPMDPTELAKFSSESAAADKKLIEFITGETSYEDPDEEV